MNKQKTVSFVYALPTSFVLKDIKFLKSINLKVFEIKSPPSKNIFHFLINRIKELTKGIFIIPKSNYIIIWFSDYHGLIPLLLSKVFSIKSIIMVGGYDAVSDKEINHGVFSKNNLRQKIAKINFKLATQIWAVDETLVSGCKNSFAQNKITSGIANWIPKIEKKVKIIPTGYSSEFWKRTSSKTPKTILTVANFTDSRVLKLKGIPLVLKLATKLVDFKFRIIGVKSKNIIPNQILFSNVEFIEPKNKLELREYFSESQYYIQASRIEGLPNALCEAMLCECIPIGNAVFGIPKAIGNSGLVFDGVNDIEQIKIFLKGTNDKTGIDARKRIISLFNEEKRINEFKKIENE